LVSHPPAVTSRCRSQATHYHESEPRDGDAICRIGGGLARVAVLARLQASTSPRSTEVWIDLERAPAWERQQHAEIAMVVLLLSDLRAVELGLFNNALEMDETQQRLAVRRTRRAA
jgi:hypothetical protein